MDIGTELFVMAATCSYAVSIKPEHNEAILLADDWCLHARKRIERLFEDITTNHDGLDNKTAGEVLKGDLKWLEEGIIPIGPDE
jgi:hypothetical protein